MPLRGQLYAVIPHRLQRAGILQLPLVQQLPQAVFDVRVGYGLIQDADDFTDQTGRFQLAVSVRKEPVCSFQDQRIKVTLVHSTYRSILHDAKQPSVGDKPVPILDLIRSIPAG